MRLNINIKKRYFFFALASFFALFGILFVYAFGTNNPEQFGHSFGEIAAPAGCSAGQVLEWKGIGVGWGCVGNNQASEEYDIVLVDEFIGGRQLNWQNPTEPYGPIPSSAGRPGQYAFIRDMFLYRAINSDDIFEVSFFIKTEEDNGFSNFRFDHTSIGVLDGHQPIMFDEDQWGRTRIAFDFYESPDNRERTHWLTVTQTPSGKQVTKTSVPLSSKGEWVKLTIKKVSQNQVEFYIDDIKVSTHTQYIPSDTLHIGSRYFWPNPYKDEHYKIMPQIIIDRFELKSKR